MRIRSIKPEFWRSEDIATLPWDVRLIFIGLWSYVDDNGVGQDNERLILADLFPLEEDPRDTLATLSRGLRTLSEVGRITRYEADGKQFLCITNWGKHQRIDKPNKARYPLPTSENAVIRDTLATHSRHTPETLAPGTGEQGNRGTEDQGVEGGLGTSSTSPGSIGISTAPHCPDHPGGTDRPCRACGAHRARHADEVADRQREIAEQRSTTARLRAQDRAHAINACTLCDTDGYRDRAVCDHTDRTHTAAAGIAQVRAALSRPNEVET